MRNLWKLFAGAMLLCGRLAAAKEPTSGTLADPARDWQLEAVKLNAAPWGYWGPDASKYSTWTSHSNRLIPVYTFGVTLDEFKGANSIYRRAADLKKLYGRMPVATLNPQAEYFDQTDVYRLQLQAAAANKKYIFLIIFDGMDWQTVWAAATYQTCGVKYRAGRGGGLAFQDYRGAATDFGFMVTSPHSVGGSYDVNKQTVKVTGKELFGGYDFATAGETPWAESHDPLYPLGKGLIKHPYTDSSASATSMTAGIKTYNEALNITAAGVQVPTIAHQLQRDGWGVGVVTSVPISHATPAAAYSHNVDRDDYQDLTRDLLGLPSISHPNEPLPGVDVLLGAGWGENVLTDASQGKNFQPGNKYLAPADLQTINAAKGGKYAIALRTAGESGGAALQTAAKSAVTKQTRLFGMFGVRGGHLPFCTANGDYRPTYNVGRLTANHQLTGKAEVYSAADLRENPTLTDLTNAALNVLEARGGKFWLMVEAGDVDWANHANNIDNSIGAVISGDLAFQAVVNWIEAHHAWDDSAVILTADHGHYLHLTRPDLLAPQRGSGASAKR